MQRRSFIKNTAILGSLIGMNDVVNAMNSKSSFKAIQGKRIGVIGLDTSHSVEFTRVLNTASEDSFYHGYRVTAAYPYWSSKIASSYTRIPSYIEKVKSYQVTICQSIEKLIQEVDCILLETNDGHLKLEQAIQVFKSGKRVFIDKPLGANFEEVVNIYRASVEYGAPFFTSSSLRYISSINEIKTGTALGKVLGASCFSPCTTEPSHEDLYWYGIHGVEMLFAVMGPGCKTVQATHTEAADIATGIWEDGRIGVFRGTRSGVNAYGGQVYCEKGNIVLGDYTGYENLLKEIVNYFDSGQVPVPVAETKGIYSFMSAFQKSKEKNGQAVLVAQF